MKKDLQTKRLVVYILIVCVQLASLPVQVFAQDVTETSGSAETVTTDTKVQLPEITSDSVAVLGDRISAGPNIDQALQSLSDRFEAASSAQVRMLTKIRDLYKKTFLKQEKVAVVIENPIDDSTITTQLLNPDGKEVSVKVETLRKNNALVVSLIPPQQFRPGKYMLTVEDTASHQKITQDFTWGVLAVNTDKSVYLPKETAAIALAVLDEKGRMVCDADVTLKIRNPKSEIRSLTSQDGSITVNPECEVKDFTLSPDYETSYEVGDAGIYTMELSATTQNGTYTISDAFEVRDSVPFAITRHSATRIFPPSTYPVTVTIAAHEESKLCLRVLTFLRQQKAASWRMNR
jgi:hypothetical protein